MSLDEVDPELFAPYEKLGIPLEKRTALSGTFFAPTRFVT